MTESPGRAPRRTRVSILAALVAAVLPLACGDSPPSREAAIPDTAASASASLPPARYLTLVAWTAEGGRPSGALWLENRTDVSGELARRYRGWRLDDGSARRVLSVDDSLPAAAAAWRPLPAPGLRLSVDPRGRISSLDAGEGELGLRLDRELASWRGATGADQRLRRGRLLSADDETAPTGVTAAVLRFERLPDDPGATGPLRTLLLSGEGGRGLLVLDEGTRRPWSRGWSWDGEGALEPLDDAALPDTARGAGAWTFRPPLGDGSRGEWTLSGADSLPADPGAVAGASSFRVLPAEARLRAGEGGRPARGFLLVAP